MCTPPHTHTNTPIGESDTFKMSILKCTHVAKECQFKMGLTAIPY